ncbi:PQQ-binding-like beta-propeller repeat protein [Rhodopirellula sp. JC740]|uniref:PQQ-binding-like beta-propeller repeat protein n=1 Tax=Rhodopirellula halodulae TaxID=2894198 RepID=A0ABS8NIG6_9BACT|nr:PQQ-binding-like beta-propeller repeat protein [Rhodopirellula sp. JC740]MCC9642583.1 PQQ-binding-like beta-propeller repeat protein [Rhodopirellula sp. JC740]
MVCHLPPRQLSRAVTLSGDRPLSVFHHHLFLVATALIGCATLLVCVPTPGHAADSWPEFRGPRGDGIVPNSRPPIQFGEEDKLTWKTKLEGKAWSSPVIADGTIWLTSAVEIMPTDEERVALLKNTDNDERKFKQLAIAKAIELKALEVDFETGQLKRTIELTTVEQPDAIHSLNSYASPTPVIDGNRLVCHFGTFGTFCLDRSSGERIWERTLPLKHAVGPGSSPIIHDGKVILIQDGMERQYVAALDLETGSTLWETDRPPMEAPTGDQKKAYCTPIVITDANGREQLLCMGSQWMVSYDAKTGNEFWRLYHGKGFSVVPRPIFDGKTVYFATGFGKPQLWAATVDGNGDVTDTHVSWTLKKSIPAKPSPVIADGLIYIVDDNGVASCIDSEDGSNVWSERLGGKFSASPILAGGHIYFCNHSGEVFVIKPGEECDIVQTNQVDGQIMASPAVINDAMILRTDTALYRFDR